MWTWLALGIGIGVLLTIPLAIVYSRRAADRVRELEQRALAAQRLAEIGTMTGGLAHEIKNPLSSVNLNLQLLQEDLETFAKQFDDGSPQHDELMRTMRRFNALSRESQRIKHILEDFLQFAGRMQLDRQKADVNQLVEELADFFVPQADQAMVNIRTNLAANPAELSIDVSLIKQAVLNLMINAVNAMEQARKKKHDDGEPGHGGANELILRTANSKLLNEPAVSVHVIDTGPGVPNRDRESIFQPYVSRTRGGSGLGLPTARRICEEHGGKLNIHSEVGRGSDFTITIPRD